MTKGSNSTEVDQVLESYFGEDYIRRLSGINDLSEVGVLTLKFDSSVQSILHLGEMLPNLRCLHLSGSKLASVRDLGIHLRHIKELHLDECSLVDLDGMGAIQDLSVLSVRNNYISDVTPLAMLEFLEVSSFTSNNISINETATLFSHPVFVIRIWILPATKFLISRLQILCHHVHV